VTVDTTWEAPREPSGPGFSDAVTFAFGDAEAQVYGVARVGLSADPETGATTASGLALLFADGGPVAVRADGGLAVDAPGWADVDAAGVTTTIDEPLREWTVLFADEAGANGFDLRFRALAPPAELTADDPVARTGGMTGYESFCRVTGTATIAGVDRPIDARGQRGHSWGAPDWDKLTVARTITAWLDDDLAVSIVAVRDTKAKAHDAEAVAAFLIEPPAGTDDDPGHAAANVPVAVGEPLVSTTYDGDGRQRAAGLELYVTDESPARRAAGEAVCGTTLDLGRLRLDCAFFRWRMEGREGIGRYDVLRRT
jgi:hypothetical protein